MKDRLAFVSSHKSAILEAEQLTFLMMAVFEYWQVHPCGNERTFRIISIR
ncbi:hypothetical protein [Mitsuokella jalaludinii]